MRGEHQRAVELCEGGRCVATNGQPGRGGAHAGTLARAQSAQGQHDEAPASASSVVGVALELGNEPL